MWIRSLRLRNIRCFEEIEINFDYVKDNSRRFSLLLGENGSGKSTILKAIALATSGRRALHFLVPDARQWVKSGQKKGSIEADIVLSPTDDIYYHHSLHIPVRIDFTNDELDAKWVGPSNRKDLFPPRRGWFVGGYGPFRVPPSRRDRTRMLESVETDQRSIRVASLFHPWHRLISVDSWLKELEYQKFKGYSKSFDFFLHAIHKLMPSDFPVKFSRITEEGLALFHTPLGEVSIDSLSDGYGSMMVWASDLLGNMAYAYPTAKHLLNHSGILLIDELDLHLHPAWQREIVPPLLELFPSLQIIATTHSPLVLQGIKNGQVIVFKREENKIQIERNLPAVEGWRADELLQAKFFDVDVYDKQTQQQLDEHRSLLAKSNLLPEERIRLQTLTTELESKRVIESFSVRNRLERDETRKQLMDLADDIRKKSQKQAGLKRKSKKKRLK